MKYISNSLLVMSINIVRGFRKAINYINQIINKSYDFVIVQHYIRTIETPYLNQTAKRKKIISNGNENKAKQFSFFTLNSSIFVRMNLFIVFDRSSESDEWTPVRFNFIFYLTIFAKNKNDSFLPVSHCNSHSLPEILWYNRNIKKAMKIKTNKIISKILFA